jgi:radical SAM protein with 4Fe4S-binding SPASM domain
VAQLFNGVDSIDFELLTIFDEKTRDLKPNNIEWSNWFDKLVEYYQHNETTWALPQIDLFTKSILSGKIYNCKCNCCETRTFTLNPNGTVGLCPDKTYVMPITTVDDMHNNWEQFEKTASDFIATKIHETESNMMCYECEYYDICGGNCEQELFDDTNECPLSKKAIGRVKQNIDTFSALYKNKARNKLTEMRNNYEYSKHNSSSSN